MKWLFVIAALFSASVQPAAANVTGEDVQTWLQRMVGALHALDYEGTFVYLHNNHLETIRVTHTVDDSGERERLISLNGAAREVVRDDASVTCVSPDTRSVSVGRRMLQGFHAIFSMDVGRLSDYYDFRFLGDARVAGRGARVVAIIPRDGFRYGYRIYLDKGNFLSLKSDMMNEDGDLISQVMFTSLETGSQIKGMGESSLEGKEDYRWVTQRPMHPLPDGQRVSWAFRELPAGFEIGLYAHSSVNARQFEMDHIVLSDGLASVSVYVEPEGKEPGLRGAARMGAISAFGRTLDGYQVTVVGEVPAAMVERVAKAIHPVP
jgi:sigma-E factor negative regulatory protein RseB